MNTLHKRLSNPWMILLVVGTLIFVYLRVLLPWMNRWGLTADQAIMSLPGDGTEPGTVITSTRGLVVNAPADEVWQWLVQLG
jgi:H+/Cl- antiporter ClcA